MANNNKRIAAVTGAASGIGRALALELANRGFDLALADVDEKGLEETECLAFQHGVDIRTSVLDVTQRQAMFDWAGKVVTELGSVDLLVNNAGVAQSGTVDGNDFGDYEWVMAANFWGVVNGSKAFLPHMREVGRGHIVNVASIFGVCAQPGMSAYNASKFAVRGFTESLRQELDMLDCGVSATCVIPGGIKTQIAHSARLSPSLAELHSGPIDDAQMRDDFLDRIARTSPEKAARIIANGVERNARRVLIGADAKFLDMLQRLLPSSYQRLTIAATKLGIEKVRKAQQSAS
ncbi:SDR family NAD(P)-dependent oxidoreductase [Marinobacter sp. LN3S78]|uniref:SDR family NAD(P)-dependent oxidoreductase n=1 Tax=Marinobacter sp. LN3S78 TaxID=3382300 RepID=UPI00387A94D4